MTEGADPKKAYSTAQLREALRLLPEDASKEEFAETVAKAKRNEELVGSMGATIAQAKRYGKTTFVFDLWGSGHAFPRIEVKGVTQKHEYLYGNVKAWVLDSDGRAQGFNERPILVRPRINFTSQRGLDDLAKGLRLVDDTDWSIAIAEIASILVDSMESGGEHTVIHQVGQQDRGWKYMLQGFLPADTVSCIMAHGGHGKTMTADLAAVALASGTVIGPFKPLVQGPVLIVDYEQRWQFHAARISRICDAIGIPVPENIHHFKPTARIMDCVDDIAELVSREGIVWTAVDSIAFAAGGDINSPEAGITSTNAMKEIPGSVTFLAHVSRADRAPQQKGPPRESAPIGSSFFWNGATVIYELKESAQQSFEDSKNYVLTNPKANVGTKWARPMAWSLKFEDPGGPISVAAEVVTNERVEGSSLPMPARIQDYLQHRGKASPKEIALGLGMIGPGGVKRATELVEQMHARGVIYKFGVGSDALYAVAAKELPMPERVDEPDAPKCRCGEIVAAYGPDGEPLCARHGGERSVG